MPLLRRDITTCGDVQYLHDMHHIHISSRCPMIRLLTSAPKTLPQLTHIAVYHIIAPPLTPRSDVCRATPSCRPVLGLIIVDGDQSLVAPSDLIMVAGPAHILVVVIRRTMRASSSLVCGLLQYADMRRNVSCRGIDRSGGLVLEWCRSPRSNLEGTRRLRRKGELLVPIVPLGVVA